MTFQDLLRRLVILNIKTRNQLQARVARLRNLEPTIERATRTLANLKTNSPSEIRIRSGFVYQADAPPIDPSDRRAPAPIHRPPATRLISPTGSSLRLYLLALYEAHLHARPGQRPSNRRPVISYDAPGHGWVDLLAPRSNLTTGGPTNVAMSTADKKKRRIVSALKALAKDDIQLVHLPNQGKRVDTYEHFQLLHEAGLQAHADPVPYTIPSRRDDHFTLPAALFLNGWIHVLEDSELAFLMMLIHWREMTQTFQVKIPSDIRVLHYGIGKETYEAHRLLTRFGLVELEADPNRRSDGTVVNHKDADWNPLHQFRITASGLENPAVEMAIKGIQKELRGVIEVLRLADLS
ncbi:MULTISPECIES: hypothetical protein [Streptosporangium]|uniref:WYL domain-containing protein n=1 Tax=Streptosporangium brasiliense TaxID=47480 RepID=A0ABT9R6N6_9ACTN|nr:hypothetical protein [Streptosporangium brasiliense]MDP9864913.1 hypothetical protein [Streptosporangium brasiliense]